MARVIFVNRFYWPDETATGQLLTDLAEALAELGHDVHVITSRPAGEATDTEVHRGVAIRRLRSTRSSGAGLIAKARDWCTFLHASFWAVRRQVQAGDVVVAMTDPPLLAITTWLAVKSRGARLVHWVQDIYPEIAIELAGQRWLAALRPLRNQAWRAAAACVTLGSDMASMLSRARVSAAQIVQIPNWPPAGLAGGRSQIDLRNSWGLAGKFVVAYSGNLGRVHDLTVVAELADALRADADVAFLVIGDGAQRQPLESEIARRQLANVICKPPQPRRALAAALASGDLHLVTLREGCEHLVFPSKLYGITAVGRPVLFVGPTDCEVARIVRQERLGLAASPRKLEPMVEFIRTLARDGAARSGYAEAARAFTSKHALPEAVRAWDRLLGDVAAKGRAA